MYRICVVHPERCPSEIMNELIASIRRRAMALWAWFRRRIQRPAVKPHSELHIATGVVLLELLEAEDRPTRDQRRHLERALRAEFGLEARGGRALLREAERARESSGVLAAVSRVADGYSMPQKVQLVRIMTELFELDGEATQKERYLLGKLSKLLRLERARMEALDLTGQYRVM